MIVNRHMQANILAFYNNKFLVILITAVEVLHMSQKYLIISMEMYAKRQKNTPVKRISPDLIFPAAAGAHPRFPWYKFALYPHWSVPEYRRALQFLW